MSQPVAASLPLNFPLAQRCPLTAVILDPSHALHSVICISLSLSVRGSAKLASSFSCFLLGKCRGRSGAVGSTTAGVVGGREASALSSTVSLQDGHLSGATVTLEMGIT